MTSKEIEDITLLGERVKLRVHKTGFRPGLDSVMLAAACSAKPGDHILDLGCGIGSAGFCLLARLPDTTLTGIDIQDELIALAKENAALNKVKQRTTFSTTTITDFTETKFDHVICNPPFLEDGNHIPSPDDSRAAANAHMNNTSLDDWIKATFNTVKSGGSLTMIHRADHVDQIIQCLGKSFGATEIIPLWPKQGIQAKRIIIRTIKHRKTPATMHPGLVIHNENGTYTQKAENTLKQAEAL